MYEIGILPFSLLGFGFLLGIKHAFDADHVVAISTMVSRHKSIKRSSLLGMFWGVGHTISLLVVGLVILLLKISIPEKVALSLEFIVGIMLVLLGINVFMTMNKNKIHFHKHRHGKEEHIHFHSHKLAKNHAHEHTTLYKSLLIGAIHGLAGSAAITLLVLTTVKSFWIGMIYMLTFGIGSILGMMLISSIISLPFIIISIKFKRIRNIMNISAGLISTAIGLIILYDIGFVEGLLK